MAACATWTRAAGSLLVVPLGLYWLQDGGLKRLFTRTWWKEAVNLFLVGAPVWAFLAFELTLGRNFHLIGTIYFDRGLLLDPESSGRPRSCG